MYKQKTSKYLISQLFTNNRVYVSVLLGLLLFVGGCARFRVDHLSASTVASVPLSVDGLEYPKQNGIYHEIPKLVAVIDNWLVAAEPSNGTIKIFNGNSLKVRLMAKAAADKKNTLHPGKPISETESKIKNVYSDQLRIPGRVVAGNDEDFFVVNYIPLQNQEKNETGGAYRILHFDLNGKQLGIIGRKGQSELPFENIIWMDTDKQGDLWVLYNNFAELSLESYSKGKFSTQTTEKQCEEALFAGETRENNQIYRCEFMYPFFNGEKVLLVGRVDKAPAKDANKAGGYQFQHRTFRIKEADGSVQTIFSHLNDPEDYPYLPYDDSQVLIWQTLNYQQLKLAVYSLSGDLTNNLQIELKGPFNQWRSTWMTLRGHFYSIQVADGMFNVIRWR